MDFKVNNKEQLSDRAMGFPMLPGPRWAKIHLTQLRYITGKFTLKLFMNNLSLISRSFIAECLSITGDERLMQVERQLRIWEHPSKIYFIN